MCTFFQIWRRIEGTSEKQFTNEHASNIFKLKSKSVASSSIHNFTYKTIYFTFVQARHTCEEHSYTLIGKGERERERKWNEYEVDAIRKIFGVEKVIKTPFEINFRYAFSEHGGLCAICLCICSGASVCESEKKYANDENAKTTGRWSVLPSNENKLLLFHYKYTRRFLFESKIFFHFLHLNAHLCSFTLSPMPSSVVCCVCVRYRKHRTRNKQRKRYRKNKGCIRLHVRLRHCNIRLMKWIDRIQNTDLNVIQRLSHRHCENCYCK